MIEEKISKTNDCMELKNSNNFKIYNQDNIDSLNFESLLLEKPININKEKFYSKLNNNLLIQISNVKCLNNFYDYNNKKYININLNSDKFNEKILKIDNIIVEKIKTNFKKWFNKSVSIENILEYFVPSKIFNHNYEPFLVLNVPLFKNEININIYDKEKKLLDNNKIESFVNCDVIIELLGINLEKEKFYCDWTLVQLKIN